MAEYDEADDGYEPRGCFSCCWSLCGLFCCPPCPSHIVAKFAFMPPTCSYTFEDVGGGIKELHVRFDPTEQAMPFTPPGNLHLLPAVPTRRGNNIAAFYLENPDAMFTILFSHGNAVDLGQMAVFLATLSQQLGCSVFAYDYSGYGRSTGLPREANLYADIHAAWNCLRTSFGVPANRIVIYGQSIGSAASVDLASHGEALGAAALVLHSPLMSGIRVLRPTVSCTWCCDPFQNIEKIHRVQAPVLVLHGTKDEVIDMSHGQSLYDRAVQKLEPSWVQGAGHNDIELYPEYADRLVRLITELRRSAEAEELAAVAQALE
eukprot:m.278851 g.278851  ORF g.278851 m.278851 type:complete len:319 (+) comp19384_c0_seq14:3672-4628(+)